MPSSNWRLIHNDGTPNALSPSEIAATPSTHVHSDDNTVFRGLGRSSTHGSNRGVADQAPGVAAQAAAQVASADEIMVAEELQRLQREAEQRGYEIGRNRAETELRAAVDGASALAEKLQEIAPERTSEIAHSIAELALSVARRIIQHEVRIEPSLLCASLEAAVSTINGSPEAHVLLNPAAVEPVAQAWEALHGRHYLGKKWFFEGDPTLPAGGCTVRYEHGFVEAGLESQIEEIGIALDRAIPGLARGTVEEGVA
ncbi:MAG TPA: FliH/SctL family protein [Candidatus Limnocylindrales bacterium]